MTRAILERGDKQKLTAVRTCSAAKAPIIALAEYLDSLTFPISGGKDIKLRKVLVMKAQPEEKAEYPCACVFPEGPPDYGEQDGVLMPTYSSDGDVDGGALFGCGEVSVPISVHIWTTEEPHRDNALMMLEDGFNPSHDQLGLILEMPHYHGIRATFVLSRVQYEDTETDNMHRWRKLILSVKSMCPVARVHMLPRLLPRAQVEVSSQV